MTKEKRSLSEAARAAASKKPLAHAVGRRKAAVARGFLRHGTGTIKVNAVDYTVYFDTAAARLAAEEPFRICPTSGSFDITLNVSGGGKSGQADAVKLCIARALIDFDPTMKPVLKKYDLLTVDARNKERKKPGQKAARKKFQFVKR
jgi:small subunit ribosomal protein S9